MSQYKTGTVTVTNDSAIVTGNGTLWVGNVTVGDSFKVSGVNSILTVQSIDSNTQITLTTNWTGSTLTSQAYQISVNFTTNYNIPEIWAGDLDWPFHLTAGLRIIDTKLSGSKETVLYDGTSDSITLEVSDLNKNLLVDGTANVDIYLPSVDGDDIGIWLGIYKLTASNVTAHRADSDDLEDGTAITNIQSSQTWSNVHLFLARATLWKIKGAPFGSWSTS